VDVEVFFVHGASPSVYHFQGLIGLREVVARASFRLAPRNLEGPSPVPNFPSVKELFFVALSFPLGWRGVVMEFAIVSSLPSRGNHRTSPAILLQLKKYEDVFTP